MKKCFLLLICIAFAFANPLLWEINTNPPSYLFGTIHYPDSRIANPGEVVFSRVDACSIFVMEIDMDENALSVMMRYSLLPDTIKLGDILPEELYQKTDSILQTMGQSIALYSMMKPWVLTLTLAMPQPQGEVVLPMDLQLQQRAHENEKETRGLETIEEQIKLFDSQSFDDQVKMLEKSINEFTTYSDFLEELIATYLEGNLDKLYEKINFWSVSEDDAEFIEDILYKRNETMLKGILEMFGEDGDKNYFFAVGAGHLAGERGLIKMLENEGYELTRITK